MRLQGKVAIVTGAGGGFGEGIAQRYAAEGAKVALVDIRGAEAERAARAIGKNTIAIAADVGNPADVERVVKETAEKLGPIDILVNNAGVTHLPGPLEAVDEDDFDRIVAVNMKAIYHAMREAVPRLKARTPGAHGIRGVVLNIASTAGVSPRPRLAWYNASKGWVITATRASAVELAPFGIRVVALNPVAGETPLLRSFMGEDTPEMRARFLATIPIGRFSTPEDLGNAACFLVSDEASMITGVCMEVDGGRCI